MAVNLSDTNPPTADFTVSLPESWRADLAERTGPALRIAVMEESLLCHAYGWLTFLPVAGTFFLIPAIRFYMRVDRQNSDWNPARHLWLRGLVLASFGAWTNLFWWATLAGLLGTASQLFQWDDIADPLAPMGFLLLFGTGPLQIGLGCVAARWQNRFGALVYQRRFGLLLLIVLGYPVMAWIISLYEWHIGVVRVPVETAPVISIYGALTLWLLWLIGGFVCLAARGVKAWWWIFWLAGAAMLTHWVAAN